MIYTEAEIEQKVSQCGGTWVKRRNLHNKLIKETNAYIDSEINQIRKQIRCLRAQGLYESDFRVLYSDITTLELRKL